MKTILRQPSSILPKLVELKESTLVSSSPISSKKANNNVSLASTSISNNSSLNSSTSNMSNNKKVSELQLQRQKHYDNIIKFEHDQNPGNLSFMNGLQDNELNDIIGNATEYINLCLSKISKYDSLINVNWTDINACQSAWSKRGKKNVINENHNFTDDKTSMSSSTTAIYNEPIITISSINPIDFLQNGLRSGPFETAKVNETPSPTKTINSKSKNETKTIVKLKYLLEFDLNPEYFDFSEVDDNGLHYAIRFKKKPKKWSTQDFDQISLDLTTNKNEPFKKVVSTISNREKDLENVNVQFDYLKLSKPKSYRYLNAKALFDRLLKSFSIVLKREWPHYHNPLNKENLVDVENPLGPSALSTHTNKTSTSTQNTNSNNNPNNSKYPICEDYKTCISKDNRLKISFKWKGARHKDLDLIILIDIGVKYDRNNDSSNLFLLNRINDSVLNLCNDFFEYGGYYKKVNSFDLARLDKISKWTSKHLKLNISLNSVYLMPSGVHHWAINLDSLKLNLLKFFIWSNSLNQTFIGVDAVTDLFNGIEINEPNKFELKQPLYNFFQATHLGKSSLQVFCKALQVFNGLFISQIEEKTNVKDENLNLLNLVVENVLLEMRHNSNGKQMKWSSDYMFDHMWYTLIRLRYYVFESKLDDSFKIFENLLPKIFYDYIGFHNLAQPLYDYEPDQNRTNEYNGSKNQTPHPCTSAFENAMRIVFSSVINDEVYFPGQAKFWEQAEKDKTIFNQKINLINEILDYKKKSDTNESENSFNTNKKATIGTKKTKPGSISS